MSRRLHLLPLLLIAAWSSEALAHHSFAMFEATKSQSQKGVIKEVQWTNPHVWVRLSVQEKARKWSTTTRARRSRC